MPSDKQDIPGIIAPPPLIFAVPLAVTLLANWRWPAPVMSNRYARILGIVLGVVAIGMNAAAFIQFRRAGTAVMPYSPTTAIVDTGPYRFTRNPIYLSMLLGYVGISLVANSVWPLLVLPLVLLVVQRGVIEREERYLEGKFGGVYVAYKSRVRRWI
jgi:protein-S-isoprenylcysteine O-methyltransferase Ste14